MLNKICEHNNLRVNFDVLRSFFQCQAYAVFSFRYGFFEYIFFYFNILYCSCIAESNEMHLDSVCMFYYYILFSYMFQLNRAILREKPVQKQTCTFHVLSFTWFFLTMAQMKVNMQENVIFNYKIRRLIPSPFRWTYVCNFFIPYEKTDF